MNEKGILKHKRHTSGFSREDISDEDIIRFCAFILDGTCTEQCWTYNGYKNSRGYGRFRFLGDKRGAHVFSYLAFVGDVRKRCEIDHECFNPSCVNPFHLKQVTKKENLATRRY